MSGVEIVGDVGGVDIEIACGVGGVDVDVEVGRETRLDWRQGDGRKFFGGPC